MNDKKRGIFLKENKAILLYFSVGLNIMLALILIVCAISIFSTHNNREVLMEEINVLEEKNENVIVQKEGVEETLVTTKAVDEITNKFIEAFYNYDNENYLARFDEIKNYATDEIVDILSGGTSIENIEIPKTRISNTIHSLEIYSRLEGDKKASVIVVTSASYTVEDITSEPVNQIFKVNLSLNEKEWIIDGFEVVGSGTSFIGE